MFIDDDTPEPGVSAETPPEPTPAADDPGAVLARYEAAGIDLRQADPVALQRGVAIDERVGPNGQFFVEKDIPGVVETTLRNWAQNPQAKSHVVRFLQETGYLPASQPKAADPDADPTETKLEELMRAQAQQAEVIEALQGDRNTIMAERQSHEDANRLKGWLDKAMQDVAGASDIWNLQESFWDNIAAGNIRNEHLTPQGIRAWVMGAVGRFQTHNKAPDSGAPSLGNPSVGASVLTDMDSRSVKDNLKNWRDTYLKDT